MNKLKRSFLEISNITLMPELRHVHVLGGLSPFACAFFYLPN